MNLCIFLVDLEDKVSGFGDKFYASWWNIWLMW